ncbi:MAG: cyclodeaminase/cyclohydrolase family protein, partial [Acidimicrobiia bacterium]|nr:cyclodeaminase/cyclohydrolase family protein [Acidimicrobiia bacterium]
LAAVRSGNPTSVTDAGVGGWCALAAAEGASMNVRINLAGLDGDHTAVVARHDASLARTRALAAEVAATVEETL